MRKQNKQKTSDETTRVKVRNLTQTDRELKNHEAEKVRGGGGPSGGVNGDRHGSGLPQT